jgi:hypothetical protein
MQKMTFCNLKKFCCARGEVANQPKAMWKQQTCRTRGRYFLQCVLKLFTVLSYSSLEPTTLHCTNISRLGYYSKAVKRGSYQSVNKTSRL